MAHSLHGEEEEPAANSNSGQSQRKGWWREKLQLVMEGFLTEGAFALGLEDWVDLPHVE